MTTCITNRCSQGHAPCPTPGVCNGPTHPALPTLPVQYAPAEETRDTVELVSKWVLSVVVLFALVVLISTAAGWLSAQG